jgi:hypothetical protein
MLLLLLFMLIHDHTVSKSKICQNQPIRTSNSQGDTYATMPTIASMIPKMPRSLALRPLKTHPRATIEQVFMWPTTVLLTAPAPAMMKNCEILMRLAKTPL